MVKFRRRMSVSEHRRLTGNVSLALQEGHLRFRHKKSADARVEMPRLMRGVHVPRYENTPLFLYSITRAEILVGIHLDCDWDYLLQLGI